MTLPSRIRDRCGRPRLNGRKEDNGAVGRRPRVLGEMLVQIGECSGSLRWAIGQHSQQGQAPASLRIVRIGLEPLLRLPLHWLSIKKVAIEHVLNRHSGEHRIQPNGSFSKPSRQSRKPGFKAFRRGVNF